MSAFGGKADIERYGCHWHSVEPEASRDACLSLGRRSSPAANRRPITNWEHGCGIFLNFFMTTGNLIRKMPIKKRKIQFRDTHILLARSPARAPDPVSKSPALRPTTTQ